MILGSRGWEIDFGNDCEDPPRVFVQGKSIKLSKEERAASKSTRATPTVSDPKGLF
jgi:hypothetical protein